MSYSVGTPRPPLRDLAGNLLASTEYDFNQDAYVFRLSSQLVMQMRHGEALLVRMGHDGEPLMEVIRPEWMYR